MVLVRRSLAQLARIARIAGVVAVAAVVVVTGATASAATAEDDDEAPKKPVVDPSVVPGPRILYGARPRPARDARDASACSTRTPVCVHATTRAQEGAALAILDAFERAWATETGALELPAPDVDPDTLAYDVFVTDAGDAALGGELATTTLEARDVRGAMDRARSFSTVDARVRPGCALDALAARSLARAIVFRAAPGTDDATARAQTSMIAGLVAPCAIALGADAAQTFQSRADRSIADPHGGSAVAEVHAADEPAAVATSRGDALYGEGGALVWWRLDWAYARAPGGLVLATWALAPTTTPLGARRWSHEPDVFDVLRASFKDRLSTGSTIHDLFLDVAVARAFMGAADDGLHAPETRSIGEAARVPLDWDLPWPTTPKRVAPRTPVAPSGASYLVIRRQGAPPGARLRVEIAWEEHALFRWALVKLDGAGRELGRVPIAAKERATEAQMTLVDLDGVDRILLVGANVGDPAYAFDPDEVVWEPHGWLVTVAAE